MEVFLQRSHPHCLRWLNSEQLSGTLESDAEAKINRHLSKAKSKEPTGSDIFGLPPEISARPLPAHNMELQEDLYLALPQPRSVHTSVKVSNESDMGLRARQWRARVLVAVQIGSGISLDQPLVTSRGTGVTACVLALGHHRLGKTDVAVYDGSWTEWSAHPDTPVATAV